MNIAIPESLKDFVQKQIDNQRYSNADEYVSALIQADKIEKARKELEEELLRGVRSGKGSPMTAEDWQNLRNLAHKHSQEFQKQKQQAILSKVGLNSQ